jgi:hypothetical protein
MAKPLTVALPPNLELSDGYVIRVTALDAATGNEVAGVKVSDIAFEIENRGAGSLDFGSFLLVAGPQG